MGSLSNDTTELSKEYDALEGTGPEPYAAFGALKEKIKLHYDIASDYYLSLWGEHIHHGYFTAPTQTKESAQVALINLLLETSASNGPWNGPSSLSTGRSFTIPPSSRILDVGCGVGGTSRHLARHHGAQVTGITISGKQVEIARRLTLKESSSTQTTNSGTTNTEKTGALATNTDDDAGDDDFIRVGPSLGKVRFIELDAEEMGEYFSSHQPQSQSQPQQQTEKGSTEADINTNTDASPSSFDIVWISEALSHFPNKPLFFSNASRVLGPGGKLVIADWFKDEDLTEKQFAEDIKPIEQGMLLPPLCTQRDYVEMAEKAGFKTIGGPEDISKEVAKTWDISWSLVQNPSLWAFAFSQGRDGIAFLQAFRAMRRGYANGTFRYAVMAFEK